MNLPTSPLTSSTYPRFIPWLARPTWDRVDPAVVAGEAIGFLLLGCGVLGVFVGLQ